ncbi:MAG TPA: pyridoxal-dependent decarboxylase [Gaiellaceae bacterium]|nr:pyridoxal-dependent decarboxylase [Gaiellaceae bacterium]
MTFRDDLDLAADWADAYLQRVTELPVTPSVSPGDVRATLPGSPPEQGETFEAMLRDFDELIVPGLTHWNHPRFFAWFANTGSEPGILAELLIAALNVNAFTWLSSPAATELEVTVMDWLAQLLGLPRGWHGHIEDTASTATIAALAAARTRRPGGVVVASEQANFSVEKAARLVGLEYRKAPVDDAFRMLPEIDLDGVTAVVATAGTTATTSVDPVVELARRCNEAGVWLHVDAAYAGSAAVCPEFRWCLDGVDAADSVVVNPHKWLFTPLDCSALWTRRPEAFHEAFSYVPEYLAATPEAIDIKDYGPALGRRFRALKLWFVLRWYGAEGLRALIREHVRLAELFASLVEAEPGWEVVAPRPFSTVCFRHVERDNDEIARAATATGEVFVATTKLRGDTVIRLAIGNERTTEADILQAWEVMRRSAA